MNTQEFDSRQTPGSKSGTLAVIEGTRFWVREDAINAEHNLVDPAVGFFPYRTLLSYHRDGSNNFS